MLSLSSTADARAGQPLRWNEPETRDAEVVVQEGQEAVLGCRAFGYPDPRVRWIHNHQVQYEYDNQFEMTLENARVENAGTWTCVVSSQCSEYGPRELRFNIQLVVSSTRLCRALLAVRVAQAQSQAYSESTNIQLAGKRRDLMLAAPSVHCSNSCVALASPTVPNYSYISSCLRAAGAAML